MKQKPDITDEEIRSYMDFDDLLKKHHVQPSAGSAFKWGKVILATGLGVALTIALYWVVTEDQMPPSEQNVLPKESQQLPQQNESTHSKLLNDSAAKTKQEPAKKTQPAEKSVSNSKPRQIPKEDPTSIETQKDVFSEAEPVDGYAKLYNYFNTNLKYPSAHLKDGIEGMEIISLTIDEEGKAIDYHVVQSLGADFDKEATRLLNSMPKWKPATLNGHPVASKISVPFTFTVNKK